MDSRIVRAAAGDEDAFSALMLASYDGLREHLRREIGAQHQSAIDPDDVLNDTFFDAWAELQNPRNSFDSERDFLALLRRIAQNRLLDAIKRESTGKRGGNHRRLSNDLENSSGSLANLLDQLDSECTSPSAGAQRAERLARLLTALDQLPADYQQLLRLRYLQGCSLEDIAEQLWLSKDQIRGRLERALQRLRDDLGGLSL